MKTALIAAALILSTNAMALNLTSHNSVQARKLAAAQFLAQANDASSKLGQVIARINSDTSDIFNPKGVIALPVKANALQVITVGSTTFGQADVEVVLETKVIEKKATDVGSYRFAMSVKDVDGQASITAPKQMWSVEAKVDPKADWFAK